MGMKFVKMLAAAGAVGLCAGEALADPVWDRIQSSGKIVCGAIPNDPVGSWIDQKTKEWEGYEIELCKGIAKDLSADMGKPIAVEFKETSWKTVVLDVQSQKVDIWPGMSATEERKRALSMVGPMYGLAFCAMTRKGTDFGKTWADLNKPEIRIATVTGTSIEAAFKKYAPKATHITLTEFPEITLAVQSGRADLMGADALRCLNVMKAAPNVFGGIVFPTPVESMGSSAGLIKQTSKLTPWLEKWSATNQANGRIKAMFFDVLKKAGFDTSLIPPEVTF